MGKEKDYIIRLEHISKAFGSQKVLDDISLDIRRGEFVTILGPSGCGKTTILRLIAGFDKPDEGSIWMEGEEIADMPPHQRNLNTVFQRYALFPHLDVYDNLAFGPKLQKVAEKEIEERVTKVLKLVNMSDYEDRSIESLSGGQQQRVAIARALINQPHILLLDEPLAALDLKMRRDMQIELKEMHEQLGITFIYVTHDQEEALTLSDTIVVMNDGKIQQIGTPTDIYNEPVNAFVANFIGTSNILNGRMVKDRRVGFIKHQFDCQDEGFGEDSPVDVVVRPEDICITDDPARCQFKAVINSCTFKGSYYEIWVKSDSDYELVLQDNKAYQTGSEVMLYIEPENIQIMKKERVANTFISRITGKDKAEFLGAVFDCDTTGFDKDDEAVATIHFEKVELLDYVEEAQLTGRVTSILFIGNRYLLTVKTGHGDNVMVETEDIWDKGDYVGIRILPENIELTRPTDGNE